ncbi:hypothetical protein ASD19_06955 [Microbacterium sp. Root53]|uniref:hypothetical protein n=1 Tax=Microbacterium sp. Root53 TaxID=1736553 RepID=UPI0006FD275B|nr:hypothetical protein [Microbacterium sp. Root53]KQY98570.1 hypothetical protein ASD19_06955 [Microbacterium sp. Root53]
MTVEQSEEEAQRSRNLTRRGLMLGGVTVLGAGALYPLITSQTDGSSPGPSDAPRSKPLTELRGEGFSIDVDPDGSGAIRLRDVGGQVIQRFLGYSVGDLDARTGSARSAEADDGLPALVVDYDVSAPTAQVRGVFTPRGRRLDVEYQVVAPGLESGSTAMMGREPGPSGGIGETAFGVADWRRDPRGGVPFEDETHLVYVQEVHGRTLAIVAAEGNADWRNSWQLSLPCRRTAEDEFRARASVIVGEEPHPAVYDAIAFERPLTAAVWTDRAFNIWDRSDLPLIVHGIAHNGVSEREVRFHWVARDFDGRLVAERTHSVVADAHAAVQDSVEVRLPGRGMAFVELTVTSGTDRDYVRTNVAVLPPHRFVEGASSMFGTAAGHLFDIPEEKTLLKRIGVRKVRRAVYPPAEAARLGFAQTHLTIPDTPAQYDGDPAALQAYVQRVLDEAEAAGVTHYECANEWNMLGEGLMSGDGARRYVEKWLVAFRQELDRRGSAVKLIPQGLAGMDLAYAQGMYDAGLARYADAFNLHPGRANVTPDYAPDPADWTRGKGLYWNYLGALREARRLIDERSGGGLELWLTEVYAPTKPNSWWEDTYRHAAENVVLSAALALAYEVTALLWYQLYDGLHASPHRADPRNREFHFGLLHRDRSPKPSLLAFANIAEHLDQATYRRWLDMGGRARRGMAFDTPRGELAILWTRADGFVLNSEGDRDGDFFPAPEPWVDTWQTREELMVPAKEVVTKIDVIGRRSAIPVEGGMARIVLDGAPTMYYGLDTAGMEILLGGAAE